MLTRPGQGAIQLGLGAIAMVAPLLFPVWGVPIIGLAVFASGLAELAQARSERRPPRTASTGVFSLIAGLVIAAQPAFVFSGLLGAIALLLALDGAIEVRRALGELGRRRVWPLVGGLANLLLAALVWLLRDQVGALGFGLLLGVRMAAAGWRQVFEPRPSTADEFADIEDEHPDRALGLPPHPVIGFLHREAIADARRFHPADLYWSSAFIVTFFAIHVGRLDAEWTLLGMISPAVATLGDVAAAALVTLAVLWPIEAGWRRLTRPLERAVWREMLDDTSAEPDLPGAARLARRWVELRLRRQVQLDIENNTLPGALGQLVRAGLPAVAVVIAVNPIWGFSWYFNSENWATAVWQKITEARTDEWREAMIRAVAADAGVDVTDGDLFAVHPPGVADGDFSFLVIGDPGEGDASQWSLRDQELLASLRDEVKFLVISSDVIYPSGEMKDYESNFYLPLKGITKPVYAIPGNHDWFNALDGFAANLMRPGAARVAMQARVDADFDLSSTTDRRVDDLIARAARLRELYHVTTAEQRGPFFEMHTPGFSLIAVDTGILRLVDPTQMAWLRAALDRSAGTFTMAVLGHPVYAAGAYQATADDSFRAVHDLLRERGVAIVMAGDTHDFEYYREPGPAGGTAQHFVNGGGGAYLSIGTPLDWPARPPTADYAFYPRTDAVTTKLQAETPLWKRPAWWWVRRIGAWPFSVEALSAVFDFNRAPFFQSFMEVRVEPSRGLVRLHLFGVDGRLRWKDIQVGGAAMPAGASADDLVEFSAPLGTR